MAVKNPGFKNSDFGQRNRLILILAVFAIMFGAYGTIQPTPIIRIALLAPFEGRYREVGYNAFYAAQLALQDSDAYNDIELLAVDDGGAARYAADRARALADDPLVKVIIVLGYAASDVSTQMAFRDKSVLIVGNWGTKPIIDNMLILTNSALDEILTTTSQIQEVTEASKLDPPIVGNEVFALRQFALLSKNTEDVTIASSASLPDAAFAERYIKSAEFTPQPGLMATLVYDATQIALQVIDSGNGDVSGELVSINYDGINGHIRFENGYWEDAPIHCYGYDLNDELVPKDCPVE